MHPRGFTIYPSWQIAVEDWCDRINGYYIARGLDTVERIVPIYAPAADGNAPSDYIAFVRGLIERWSNGIIASAIRREYHVIGDGLQVRTGYGRQFPPAAEMNTGDVFVADEIRLGEEIDGDARWGHRADGFGFSSMKYLVRQS